MVDKIPLWLDCDPGHDDAVAIILAAYHPQIELLGVSTVHGNAPLDKTTYNALSVLTAIGKEKEIRVYEGASRPLVREPSYAPSIHGESGLEGSDLLPKPQVKPHEDDSAVDGMYRAILAHPGEIAIVATGTFTNVAQLFISHPEVKSKVKYLSFMGGGIEEANWGAGEFNIWCDPHAANLIFKDEELKEKLILIPIDLTHKLIATLEIEQRILNKPNTSNLRQMIFELISFFKQTYIEQQGFKDGPPVHDPLLVIALLPFYGLEDAKYPVQLEYTPMNIYSIEDGELNGKLEIVDKKEDGVKVGLGMNIANFWEIVLQTISLAEEHSTI